MNFTDFFSMVNIVAEAEKPSLFPFPVSFHIVFVIIALIFFVLSFLRFKRPYQAILAVAAPFSLLIEASEGSKGMYYAVGAIEFILILAAFISTFIFKPKKEEKTEPAADADAKEE